MRVKDFYNHMKQAKKTEQDPIKRKVALDIYEFMWECGASRSGVLGLIERRTARAGWDEKITPAHIEHYTAFGKLLT